MVETLKLGWVNVFNLKFSRDDDAELDPRARCAFGFGNVFSAGKFSPPHVDSTKIGFHLRK